MTHPESDRPLEDVLQSVRREIEPARDLWPGIESRLEPRPSRRRWPAWAWQAAAAVALVAVSSLVTAAFLRQSNVPVAQAPAARPPVVPASYASGSALNADYEAARRQLAVDLEQRLATLPPSARQKIEANLAEMRRAAEEINAALARQPGDTLLEELLMNTYQDELGVLASVKQLTGAGVGPAPARQEKIRL